MLRCQPFLWDSFEGYWALWGDSPNVIFAPEYAISDAERSGTVTKSSRSLYILRRLTPSLLVVCWKALRLPIFGYSNGGAVHLEATQIISAHSMLESTSLSTYLGYSNRKIVQNQLRHYDFVQARM